MKKIILIVCTLLKVYLVHPAYIQQDCHDDRLTEKAISAFYEKKNENIDHKFIYNFIGASIIYSTFKTFVTPPQFIKNSSFLQKFGTFSENLILPFSNFIANNQFLIAIVFSENIKLKVLPLIEYFHSKIYYDRLIQERLAEHPYVIWQKYKLKITCLTEYRPSSIAALNRLIDSITQEEREKWLKYNYIYSKENDEKSIQEKIIFPFETVLKLPHATVDLNLTHEDNKLLDELLITYPPTIKRQVYLLNAYLKDYSSCRKTNTCVISKPVLLFLGKSGTGKSYLITEYAKIIKKPLVEFSLSKMQELNKLTDADRDLNTKGMISYLTKAILQATQSNPDAQMIFFFYGIDKYLNENPDPVVESFMLKLFDPQNNYLFLEDLNYELNLEGCVFILEATHNIKSRLLMNRVKVIEFPQLNEEKRFKIGYDVIWKEIVKKRNIITTDEDRKVIDTLVILDKDPGAMKLKMCIEEYVLCREDKRIPFIPEECIRSKENIEFELAKF